MRRRGSRGLIGRVPSEALLLRSSTARSAVLWRHGCNTAAFSQVLWVFLLLLEPLELIGEILLLEVHKFTSPRHFDSLAGAKLGVEVVISGDGIFSLNHGLARPH